MNREIKFRQPIRDKKGKFLEWFYWGFIDGEWIQWAIQQNGLDTRKEGEQFTGLKDSKGTEVYEGDIFLNVDTGEHCFVEYFEDGFYTNYPSRFIELTQSVTRFRLSNSIGNLHYVVGNIYQNIELIKNNQ